MKKAILRFTAQVLLLTMTCQLVQPTAAYALTTGPSQPEVQSFEPVGTTEMVNTFTGDFVYNIPLLDVEGYPVNISYHSGVSVEQEASWCGLGWNINPGEINHIVRGLPDDFKGEQIEKELHIKSEKNYRVGVGGGIGFELGGWDGASIGLSMGLYGNYNNYNGLSVGMNTGASLNIPYVSVGIDVGIGSQSGADIDPSISFSASKRVSGDIGVGATVSASTGFNTRQGLRDVNLSIAPTVSYYRGNETYSSNVIVPGYGGVVFNRTVPIGIQNYVPVITNRSTFKSFQFQFKAGGEIYYAYPNGYLNAQISTLEYDPDGTKSGYGYLYSELAGDEAIMDFSRDRDGVYNRTLPNLPPGTMAYDVYSIAGQGTGGSFRPFRNDIGTFHDPHIQNTSDNDDDVFEAGYGNLFEVGDDYTIYDDITESGYWKNVPYKSGDVNSLYEKTYFKQAGELTYNQQQETNSVFNDDPIYMADDAASLKGRANENLGSLPSYLGSTSDRSARANLISYFTGDECAINEVAQVKTVDFFSDNPPDKSRYFDPVEHHVARSANNDFDLRGHQISEFIQTQTDGRRYVYGLPAINHASREVTFSVDESSADLNTGLVTFAPGDNTASNQKGRDNYYSSTTTPSYAHSYLLSSVLSTDYVDILGDGPTDDDLGTHVKFNYNLWNNDYRWRTPYQSNIAQYNPGFNSDNQDGRGMYLIGSRQSWQLRSIESKNYIAEFYVSPRTDALGATDPVLQSNSKMRMPSGTSLSSSTTAGTSFKLDSIKLYNKHERYLKENGAIAIKTIIFTYDYHLCDKVPNTANNVSSMGKLTLKQIYIRYGNSDKNLLNPYTFGYNAPNPDYDFASKDRWGNYKKSDPTLTNYDFPYTKQSGAGLDDTAASWNLTDINLPSGGAIQVQYEQKDYSYVQDRRTMQMFMLEGIGSSPNLDRKNTLYESESNINDYVYFKRNKAKESSKLSLHDNYLEGQDLLYYNFNLDITGNNRFEHIKGYAKIDSVGTCPNNDDYGFIKLSRDNAGSMSLSPVTIYGTNYARYYLPHILYPGFSESDGDKKIITGLLAAADELRRFHQNPFKKFIEDGKARKVQNAKSWMRLQVPGLTKRGGGVRVKKIILNDYWSELTNSGAVTDATYGKQYDYTIDGGKYGTISSGVASYEPLVGGDENPFRRPVPYTADGGRLLPAIEFFQEEPFGENFFPSPVVGYSSVRVKSIHSAISRSSQAEDEYLYYTAKDFPVIVEYTNKETPDPVHEQSLTKSYREEHALQGYVIRFNDMHGKPLAINNYVNISTASGPKRDPVTKTIYHYNRDATGKLSNKVKALVRSRGNRNLFDINDVELGKEMDFSIDSRSTHFRAYARTIQTNVNAVLFGVPPFIVLIPIPTAFFPDKEDVKDFRMMVSTKIIQQYGVVSSVEHFDHGATTIVDNVLYDGETGRVLLSKVNNEFNDSRYSLNYPAHLAYLGMGPAYTNIGYEETGDSVNQGFTTPYGTLTYYYLKTSHKERFYKGDEVLATYKLPNSSDTTDHYAKLWVTDVGNPTYGDNISTLTNYCRITLALRTGVTAGVAALPIHLGNVRIRVLRSGRRNMLDRDVQNTVLGKNPYVNSINDLFSNTSANGNAFDNAISVTGTTFTDDAQLYTYQTDSLLSIAGSFFRTDFNAYVTGKRGNFRPDAQYVYNGNRSYSKNHVRYDGMFALNDKLWNFTNNHSYDCRGNTSVLDFNSSNPFHAWQYVSQLHRVDEHGHSIEEFDATGNYSAAQYGYNQSLPTAVAINARQSDFFFDGFEENALLAPQNMRLLSGNSSAFNFSPFAPYFRGIVSASSYSNANASGSTLSLRRNGQNYNLFTKGGGSLSGLALTREASHSGYYALKTSAKVNVAVPTYYGEPADHPSGWGSWMDSRQIMPFSIPLFRKSVVDVWVRKTSGTGVPPACSLSFGGTTFTLSAKSSSIDGWYLFEGLLDFSAFTGSWPSNSSTPGASATLSIPSGVYIDDVRIVPVDASMKSFVYDPMTFKLIAQLDENNMASFYEYDQEGLLVRTKKETSQGIKTITESRKASAKP